MKTTNLERVGCSCVRVVEILGHDRRTAIYNIERARLEYGEHWFWAHQNTAFTAAGLRVMADAFDELGDRAAGVALRAEAGSLAPREITVPAFPKPQPKERPRDRRERQYKDSDEVIA